MAFSKSVILLVIAALSASDAFAPASPFALNTQSCKMSSTRIQALSLSLDNADDMDVPEDNEPAPEDFIVNVGDIDDEPSDASSNDEEPKWQALNDRIAEMRIKHRRSEVDTGSPEYQVAGMTERISYLTLHLKEHPKDFSTRRGLVALVNKRRRLLNYLHSEDIGRYRSVIESMGIRHKEPSRVQSKDEQYGRFPPQKTKVYKNS